MKNFPAFPVTLLNKHEEEAKDPFGYAVPANGGVTYTGLTALDYFAGEALKGLLSADTSFDLSASTLSRMSYQLAVAMMEEREKWL